MTMMNRANTPRAIAPFVQVSAMTCNEAGEQEPAVLRAERAAEDPDRMVTAAAARRRSRARECRFLPGAV